MISTRSRTAFTLVELLAVIVLITLLAGMIVTAVNGVTRTAREARTRSIIAAIDSVLQEHYESYKYRPYSVEIPATFNVVNDDGNTNDEELGYDVLATETARVRLMMLRDLQRMELPDRMSDILDAPQNMRAAANFIVRQQGTDLVQSTRDELDRRVMLSVNWYDSNATFGSGLVNVPSRLEAYRDRIRSVNPTFTLSSPGALTNQGAECLFLIMSTSYVGGTPAIDAIPISNIADTDGDGLNEILDGWGEPLEFIRWPVGYFDPELSIDTTVPDDFDLFRADYYYVADLSPMGTTFAVPLDVNSGPTALASPWSIRPLVFSKGANKQAGIAINPWTSPASASAPPVEEADFSYQDASWRWPVNQSYYGPDEYQGRTQGPAGSSEHPFPDPFLRRFVADNQLSGVGFGGLLPGQLLRSVDANEESSDNLTNYSLQAKPR